MTGGVYKKTSISLLKKRKDRQAMKSTVLNTCTIPNTCLYLQHGVTVACEEVAYKVASKEASLFSCFSPYKVK